MLIACHSRRWGTPHGGPDGMAVAASYLAHTLCDLGYSVRGHREDHRTAPPWTHPRMQWAPWQQVPSFDADLIITTHNPNFRRVALAAVDAGANERTVYWHHYGGLPPDYGCIQAAPPTTPAHLCLPPSSWAVEDGGECGGPDILIPGASIAKGGHVARQVAGRCPGLSWYVLRGRCSNDDVNAWSGVGDVAPGQVPTSAILARTRAVLAPTRFETYGLLLVEAAVRGIPIVCTDLPATRDALRDSAIYVPIDATLDTWSAALRVALAEPLPRLVLPPYREVVASALIQLQRRRAA